MRQRVISGAALVAALLVCTSVSIAEVPSLINYQGRLTDSEGVSVDTTVSISFTLYDDSLGTAAVWTETHESVAITDGLFNVLLGSVEALDATIVDGSVHWLGIAVGDAPQSDPLQPIVSVAYAYRAEYSDTAQYAVSAGGISGGGGWTDEGTTIRLTTAGDSVGIGTSAPSERLDVNGNLRVSGKATIGHNHTNTQPHTFVSGDSNVVSSTWASVVGGLRNSATSGGAIVSGGFDNEASGHTSAVVGGTNNAAAGIYAIVTGGASNQATAGNSAVLGGANNTAGGSCSAVMGGYYNSAPGGFSVVCGGQQNESVGLNSTVGGGAVNFATGYEAGIAAGGNNRATGVASCIPGGRRNVAAGDFSLAGGLWAKANHDGCFVWADSSDEEFPSSANNQFLIRASGGVGINTNNPLTALHIGGTPGEDGIAFPDGSVQFTAAGEGAGGWVDDGSIVRLGTSTDSVGIGTDAPTATLEVAGLVKSSELHVGSPTRSGWFNLYMNGASAPTFSIGNNVDGGWFHSRDPQGYSLGGLWPDGNGVGGYFSVSGDTAFSTGFHVDGNYAGTNDPHVWIRGSDRSARFNMNASGDASVNLPIDAISRWEILDEPGVATRSLVGTIEINRNEMSDIVLVTLDDIPAPGYIIVTATCHARFSGTIDENRAVLQIDQSSGGGWAAQAHLVGQTAYEHSWAVHDYSCSVQRAYYKNQAGMHTFRLEAMKLGYNGVAEVGPAMIVATYYPTAYGGVAAVVSESEASRFDHAIPLDSDSSDDLTEYSESVYRVDLRELEFKVDSLRTELEKMQRTMAEVEVRKQKGSFRR